MRFLRSTVLIATLGLLTPCAAFAEQPSPSGQDAAERQGETEALAKRAFEAYSKNDYTTALSLYQQALQIAPAAAIYFNIASIYDKKLPDPQLAIEFYRKCLTAPDASPEIALKASARIQALNQELSGKAGGAPSGPSSSKPEQPANPPNEPPAEPGRALRITGIVVGSLGVVGLGLGIGFGVDAKVKLDRAKQVCTGNACKTQAGKDDMIAAGNSATVATGLFIAGGAAIGIGLGLYLFAPRKPEPTTARISSVRLDPVLGPSQAGLTLSGAFF